MVGDLPYDDKIRTTLACSTSTVKWVIPCSLIYTMYTRSTCIAEARGALGREARKTSGIGGLERNRANPRVPGRASFNTGSKILEVGIHPKTPFGWSNFEPGSLTLKRIWYLNGVNVNCTEKN